MDVLEFKDSEKILYTSNGNGVQFYISLRNEHLIYVSGVLDLRTYDLKEAVDYFNEKCKTAAAGA